MAWPFLKQSDSEIMTVTQSTRLEPKVDIAPAPARPPAEGQVFAADAPAHGDALGQDGAIRLMSELICHARTDTPLTIAALGGPGSGKSTFLKRLAVRVEMLSNAAAQAGKGPYAARFVIARLDALRHAADAEAALAMTAAQAIGAKWPALASEALHAVRDAHQTAREAAEASDAARRRLEAERRALQETEARQSRLVETVLYDAGGTRIDAFVRSRRGELDARQRAFGFSGDPIDTFKDLVRDISGAGGPLARAAASTRALWAFRGQSRLLVLAIVALLLAWGLGHVVDGRAVWLGWLRANGEQLAPAANWLEAHIGWAASLRSVAFIAALAALAVNLLRAFRFMRPILRGVALLREDVETRRRDLDNLAAHHARRVETLTGEAEAAARLLDAAERRVGTRDGAQTPLPFALKADAVSAARAFFARLDDLIDEGKFEGPQRFAFVVDGLDALPASERLALVERVSGLSRHAATLVAVDPNGLDAGRLEKLVQLPLQLGDVAGDRARGFVSSLLEPKAAKPAAAIDPAASLFNDGLSDDEKKLLADLAPVAGDSPRALKRFVNIYRVARHAAPQARAALALALAVETGADAQEKGDFDAFVGGSGSLRHARLREAVDLACEGGLALDTLANGARIARAFSLRG